MEKKEAHTFNTIMARPPRCPLCHATMETAWDPIRCINILVCRRDEIGIAVTDPLVGRWEGGRAEVIPCPNCDTPMRVFFTSVGFMKAKCPNRKCGCAVRSANVSEDTKTMPGALMCDGMAHS